MKNITFYEKRKKENSYNSDIYTYEFVISIQTQLLSKAYHRILNIRVAKQDTLKSIIYRIPLRDA